MPLEKHGARSGCAVFVYSLRKSNRAVLYLHSPARLAQSLVSSFSFCLAHVISFRVGEEVTAEDVTGNGDSTSLEDVQAKVNRDLQKKLRRLLTKRPSEQFDLVKNKFLPRIFRDKDIRRNTYINRPKTEYDLYMRHKLTDQTIQKYLQQRHLLSKRREDGRGDARRMPLPYRRFIVNHIQPTAVYLPSGELLPSHLRRGTPLPEPLKSILPGDGSRVRTKIARSKRKPYGHHHDPHKPDRDAETKKKKKPKKGSMKI